MSDTNTSSVPPSPSAGASPFADMMAKVDFQAILARINEFISTPVPAWDRVKSESFTERELFEKFYVPMVIIASVCAFIGGSLLGPMPITSGLLTMILQAIIGLVSPIAVYFIMDFLIPRFSGTATKNEIFKFIIFPTLIVNAALAFQIIPAVKILSIISSVISLAGGVYGLYLWWIGTPIMLGIPDDKRPQFFIAYVGVVIVLFTLLTYVASMVMF